MAESVPGSAALTVSLDPESLDALHAAAAERGVSAEDLAGRWLRERIAHERERQLGRQRQQRQVAE